MRGVIGCNMLAYINPISHSMNPLRTAQTISFFCKSLKPGPRRNPLWLSSTFHNHLLREVCPCAAIVGETRELTLEGQNRNLASTICYNGDHYGYEDLQVQPLDVRFHDSYFAMGTLLKEFRIRVKDPKESGTEANPQL